MRTPLQRPKSQITKVKKENSPAEKLGMGSGVAKASQVIESLKAFRFWIFREQGVKTLDQPG